MEDIINSLFDEDELDYHFGEADFDIDNHDEYHPSFGASSLSEAALERIQNHQDNIIDDFRKMAKSTNSAEIENLSKHIESEKLAIGADERDYYFQKQHEISHNGRMALMESIYEYNKTKNKL